MPTYLPSTSTITSEVGEVTPCTEGDTQTTTCSDGSVIVTSICDAQGVWQSTGNTCPVEEKNYTLIILAGVAVVFVLLLISGGPRREEEFQ